MMVLNFNNGLLTLNEFVSLVGYENSNIVYESSYVNEQVRIDDISGESIKHDSRYVLLNAAENVHFARMKVSNYGEKVRKYGNDPKSISIYYAGGNYPEHDGGPKDIKMSNAELGQYKELFMRNLNLIYLNGTSSPYKNSSKAKNLPESIDKAFLHDERLRIYVKNNIGVIKFIDRDELGNLLLLNKKLETILKLDLFNFKVIGYDKNYIYDLYYHYLPFLNKYYGKSNIYYEFILFIKSTGIYV